MNALQVAGGIIVNAQGELLLAQRPPGKHLAGLWEFPGGKIEAGETPTEALARELKEELGLEVLIQDSVGVFGHTYDWGRIDLHVFVVFARNEPRASADVEVFKWVQPGQVNPLELAPADREPLEVYLRLRR